MVLSCGASAAAQSARDSFPSILTYKTVKVAEGIYAFITPEERSGFQSGNSVAVIGDEAVLVFDTGNIPSMARRQIAEIRTLTSRPVRYVVNSHWHPDHNLGNAEYRDAFPEVTIIGTSATREGILERVPTYPAQMRAFAPTDSLMRLRLSTGKLADGSPLPAARRALYEFTTRDFREFLPDMSTSRPVAPSLVFDDSISIALGHRVVKVVGAGRGNTAGDAFLYVPDAAVLLTGDLLTVPCPFPGTAYFSAWIGALDRLEGLHAAVLVPGHGDVQHDYGYLRMTRELLAFTRDRALAAASEGRTIGQFRKDIDLEPFIARFAGDDPVRRFVFQNAYIESALPRALEEAASAAHPVPSVR